MKKLKLALIGILALAAGQAMACYTVYDAGNRVLYQGVEPPVDMSRPLHETLQRRYPGASMVFEQTANCGALGVAQLARPGSVASMPNPAATVPNTAAMGAGPAPATRSRAAPQRLIVRQSSPLLTDRATATAMHLPYTPLGDRIVVVPAEAAAGAVRPSVTVVPSGLPAQRSLTSAAPAPRAQTMITELRGGETYVSQQ
ncbi:MAG: hypothetical protein V4864_08895 [Pseudomonadota bacterium]